MARSPSTPDTQPIESGNAATEERLPKWVLVSLFVHLGLILTLILVPFGSSNRREPPPSYVVDLVGGERIGGRNLGTQIEPETKAKPRVVKPPPPPPVAKVEPPPPPPVAKKEKKIEKAPEPKKEKPPEPKKVEKAEKVKPKPKEEVVLAKKQEPQEKKETAQKPPKETKEADKPDEYSLDKVRERVIQAAIERARSRAASQTSSAKASKSEPLSAGSGEGLGAESLGKGGVGGAGILKSVEFIAYQNQLINTIKSNWAWAGRNNELRVVVQLGINEKGQVVGLKVTQPSGDATYDESVIRAIKRSNPFDAPPEAVREEFANFNITFKPSDFGA